MTFKSSPLKRIKAYDSNGWMRALSNEPLDPGECTSTRLLESRDSLAAGSMLAEGTRDGWRVRVTGPVATEGFIELVSVETRGEIVFILLI